MWASTSDGQLVGWNVVTHCALNPPPLGGDHPLRHSRDIEGERTYCAVTATVGVDGADLSRRSFLSPVFTGSTDQTLRRIVVKPSL